jgi:hypothetical protein
VVKVPVSGLTKARQLLEAPKKAQRSQVMASGNGGGNNDSAKPVHAAFDDIYLMLVGFFSLAMLY